MQLQLTARRHSKKIAFQLHWRQQILPLTFSMIHEGGGELIMTGASTAPYLHWTVAAPGVNNRRQHSFLIYLMQLALKHVSCYTNRGCCCLSAASTNHHQLDVSQ